MSTPMTPTAWLAQADPDPDHYFLWTKSTKSVMLPAGRFWDAVKVPAALGLHISDQVGPVGIAGPSHHDRADGSVYFLVPVGTALNWPAGIEYLGDTTHICTPAIGVTDGVRPYWIQEPDGSGALVDPNELLAALSAAAAGAVA